MPQGLRLGDPIVGQPAHLRQIPEMSLGWAGAGRGCSALGSLQVRHHKVCLLHQRCFPCRLSPVRCGGFACICAQGAFHFSQAVSWSLAVMSRSLIPIPHESTLVTLAAGQPGPQQTLSRSVDEVGQGEGGRRKAEVDISC